MVRDMSPTQSEVPWEVLDEQTVSGTICSSHLFARKLKEMLGMGYPGILKTSRSFFISGLSVVSGPEGPFWMVKI